MDFRIEREKIEKLIEEIESSIQEKDINHNPRVNYPDC